MRLQLGFVLIALASVAIATSAVAQTAPTPLAPAAVVPSAATKTVPQRRCMRLPLTDIAVGRPETIALAQLRLGEYAVKEASKRGWAGALAKSDETVTCEDYLYLPLIGQEYKCFVTATFCVK